MKKLFFTALVAVVAVGGAIAQITVEDQFGNPVTCDAGNALCSTYPGGLFDPITGQQIPPATFGDLQYVQ